MEIRNRIEELLPQMKEHLGRLVKYDSVRGEAQPGKPFGEMPAAVLAEALQIVREMGFAAKNVERCKKALNTAILFGVGIMSVGTLCFALIPEPMIRMFSADVSVIEIGKTAFPIIGICYIPIVTSLIYPVFFQAVGQGLKSSFLTVVRTVFLFVPLGYLFSRFGLDYFWLTFSVTDAITSVLGFVFYLKFMKSPYRIHAKP